MSAKIAVNHETISLLKRGLAMAAAAEASRARLDSTEMQGNFAITVQVKPRWFAQPRITIEVAEIAVPVEDAR